MSARRTVLVTGATGQLGAEVVTRFGRAAGWTVRAMSRDELDVTDAAAVDEAVAGVDVVLNTAAYTKVDDAESEQDAAFAVNAGAVGHLVQACVDAQAQLCHISTDYVFDGTKVEPYVESDRPNPQSVYGRSKLAGERLLRADDLLVRTSWLYSAGGPDMVHTVLRLAGDPDRELAFVADQRGCPTLAADLAGALFELVDGGYSGTFHVTNAGPVSWYEFACEILAAADMDPGRIRPITTAELDPPRPATRPANSVLDGAALRLCEISPLRHHSETLPELVGAIRRGACQ